MESANISRSADASEEQVGKVPATTENDDEQPRENKQIDAAAAAPNYQENEPDAEDEFDRFFQKLVAFKQRNGHTKVPKHYSEDMELAQWVGEKRRQFKQYANAESHEERQQVYRSSGVELTPDQAKELEGIGFEYSNKNPRHMRWDFRYQQLKEFSQKYGHTQVPIGWEENVKLANWVSTQRQEYKNLKKGRTSQLNDQRIQLLTDLGFAWEVQRGGRRRQIQSKGAKQAVSKEDEDSAPCILPGKALVGGKDGMPMNISNDETSKKGGKENKKGAKMEHGPNPEQFAALQQQQFLMQRHMQMQMMQMQQQPFLQGGQMAGPWGMQGFPPNMTGQHNNNNMMSANGMHFAGGPPMWQMGGGPFNFAANNMPGFGFPVGPGGFMPQQQMGMGNPSFPGNNGPARNGSDPPVDISSGCMPASFMEFPNNSSSSTRGNLQSMHQQQAANGGEQVPTRSGSDPPTKNEDPNQCDADSKGGKQDPFGQSNAMDGQNTTANSDIDGVNGGNDQETSPLQNPRSIMQNSTNSTLAAKGNFAGDAMNPVPASNGMPGSDHDLF